MIKFDTSTATILAAVIASTGLILVNLRKPKLDLKTNTRTLRYTESLKLYLKWSHITLMLLDSLDEYRTILQKKEGNLSSQSNKLKCLHKNLTLVFGKILILDKRSLTTSKLKKALDFFHPNDLELDITEFIRRYSPEQIDASRKSILEFCTMCAKEDFD